MAPDTVANLSQQVREALHLAAWIEAMVNPSLMPIVPTLPRNATAEQGRVAINASKFRDSLEAALFPSDELTDG